MLWISNYNIREGRMTEYQKYVKENEKKIKEHAPKGMKFLGVYFYVLGFGPYHVAELWEISDYADLDAFRNHNDPAWLKLMEESAEFATNEPIVSWLMREAADTKITEPKPKKKQ
jgi:hypothetical protein